MSYGFYGDVSYTPQNRYKVYDRGTQGLGLISPEPSGAYLGAPGRLVRLQPRSRDVDRMMMRGLGVTLAGPGLGDLSDRELCSALTQAGGALVSAVGSAVIGARPTRRAGETDAQYNARVGDWETQTRVTTAGGTGVTAASALCNLIDEASPNATVTGMSELQLMQARMELERLYAQQQQAKWTKIAIGAGVVGVVGAAAYLLLRK